jgi:cytidylate kinase
MDFAFSNISISGLPGAGATTLGKSLAQEIAWDYFGGGDFMRAYAIKQGLFDPVKGLHHDASVYDDEFDRQVDFGMRQKVSESHHNVLESWLSGFMVMGKPGVLKVLITCSDDSVRIDRIVNRDEVSVEHAKQHIFERERKNLLKWQRLYAAEWREWVVDPGIMDASEPINFWDERLYDLVVDTYSSSKEQALKEVLAKLTV